MRHTRNESELSIGVGGAALWMLLYLALQTLAALPDIFVLYMAPAWVRDWAGIALEAGVGVLLVALLRWRHPAWRVSWRISWGDAALAIAGAFACFLAGNVLMAGVVERLFPRSLEVYEQAIGVYMFNPVTGFLSICVLAPVIEEVLVRGFILPGMERRYGLWPAVLLSTLMFAAMHFNLAQGLVVLVIGLALALLYMQTRSLLACILMHAVYNLFSYLIMLFFG